MNVFKKIYCRTFQFIMKVAIPFLPYRKPIVLEKQEDILNVLKEKNKEELYLIYPKDGVALNDSTFAFIDNGESNYL